ncbi:MAG: hypothetical protein JXR77_14055 [Lentisphaeria bacterium]|nr:hypothetical protein [Lentisphaeria bacterium]
MIGAARCSRRLRQAFSLTEILAVSAIVTSIPAAQYAAAKQRAVETKCKMGLQQIGQMVQMYHLSEGKYPEAVFYPSDAYNDPKSIVRVMEEAGYAIPREMWICPAAPKELADRGLTFVYNEKCGGRATLKNPSKAWLLIEMNCVSKRIPPPHPGGYNVLCADGHVVTGMQLPPDLEKLQQARLPALPGTGRVEQASAGAAGQGPSAPRRFCAAACR